jgi:hypothetical protein
MYDLNKILAGMAGGYYAVLMASVSEHHGCSSMLMNCVSHPYFLQLCRITTSSTTHGAVFYGGTLFDLDDDCILPLI